MIQLVGDLKKKTRNEAEEDVACLVPRLHCCTGVHEVDTGPSAIREQKRGMKGFKTKNRGYTKEECEKGGGNTGW